MENGSGAKWKIGWGFTSKCNMNCSFCYSNSVREKFKEIELQSALNFVDNNIDLIDSINYGTGENSLSDQWYKLISYIKVRYPQIRQAVTTNGSVAEVLSKKKINAEDFFKWISEVDISLDFANRELHNRIRGNKNAYDWVIDTLALCNTYGITTTIVMVAFDDSLSIKNIEGIFELARNYNGFVRMNILRPTGKISISPPSYIQLIKVLKFILKNHRVVSLSDPLFSSLFDYKNAQPESTGITSLRILPNGYITPSTYLLTEEWYSYNLNENNVKLADIDGTYPFELIKDNNLPNSCKTCPYSKICRGGAVDRRILHYNSLAERDPYCPMRYGESIEMSNDSIQYVMNGIVPEVHNGYLPTLIFAP